MEYYFSDIDNRVNTKNKNNRHEKWPLDFVYGAQLSVWQTHALSKTKKNKKRKKPLLLSAMSEKKCYS